MRYKDTRRKERKRRRVKRRREVRYKDTRRKESKEEEEEYVLWETGGENICKFMENINLKKLPFCRK